MAAGLDICLTFVRPSEKGGLVAFCFEDELEPLNKEDYDCAVELFQTLMAIKRLDAARRLAIGFYLEAHVGSTSWLFHVNGIASKIAAGKLVSFHKALEKELSKVEHDKLKVEDKANKAAKTN